MGIILYHLSPKDIEGEIKPRIPQETCRYENNTIKRISMAESIQHCLIGLGENIDTVNMRWLQNIPYYLYEFEINEDDEKLIHPDELYEQDLMYHAKVTREYWYKDPIKPKKKTKIFIEPNTWEEPEYVYVYTRKMKEYLDNNNIKFDTNNEIIDSICHNISGCDIECISKIKYITVHEEEVYV